MFKNYWIFCLLAYSPVLIGKTEGAQPQEYQEQHEVEQTESANEVETLPLQKTAVRSTVAFLKDQSPEYALDAKNEALAQAAIKKGNDYLKAIMAGTMDKIPVKFDKPFAEIQKDYLNAIIALSWALFDKAVRQGEGFTGGTIVFEDKGHKVFNFLFDYAKKANDSLANGKRNPKYISQNCFAYERHSSHFPEMQDAYGQFGVDMRYGNGDLEKLLPANKSHLLFGQVASKNKELSFIKMEVYGLCARDASVIKHGLEFLKGNKGKKGPSRREAVPKEVKNMVEQMLNEMPKENRAAVSQEIGKPAIIKNIYSVAKKLATIKGVPGSKKAQELVTYLEKNFDHLDIRRGNEVILEPLS